MQMTKSSQARGANELSNFLDNKDDYIHSSLVRPNREIDAHNPFEPIFLQLLGFSQDGKFCELYWRWGDIDFRGSFR